MSLRANQWAPQQASITMRQAGCLASELAFEDGITVYILPDEMKGVLTDVEAIECDSWP